MKFQTNDEVMVLRGSEKGKKGTIIEIDNAKNKVKISGIKMIVKHMKPKAGKPGGRFELEGFIDASNVMHLDSSGKPTRMKSVKEGKKKVRLTTKGNKEIVKGKPKAAPKVTKAPTKKAE